MVVDRPLMDSETIRVLGTSLVSLNTQLIPAASCLNFVRVIRLNVSLIRGLVTKTATNLMTLQFLSMTFYCCSSGTIVIRSSWFENISQLLFSLSSSTSVCVKYRIWNPGTGSDTDGFIILGIPLVSEKIRLIFAASCSKLLQVIRLHVSMVIGSVIKTATNLITWQFPGTTFCCCSNGTIVTRSSSFENISQLLLSLSSSKSVCVKYLIWNPGTGSDTDGFIILGIPLVSQKTRLISDASCSKLLQFIRLNVSIARGSVIKTATNLSICPVNIHASLNISRNRNSRTAIT